MKTKYPFLLIFSALIIISCSSEPKWETALLSGEITVADSIDASNNFSGIQILITYREDQDSKVDTLFSDSTNVNGKVSGKVKFPERGLYPVFLKRNGRQIGVTQFILADKDTINFSAELPGLEQTIEIDSREHRAMNTFKRIDKNFNRVLAYINAGAIEDSMVYDEINKWSDLFWEVSEKNKGTIAANLSATESVRLLNFIDKEKMMSRLNEAITEEGIINTASNYGLGYVSEFKGLDKGIEYLDSLIRLTDNESTIINLSQKKVELYYDSSRVEEAKASLEKFEKSYKSNQSAMEWAKNIGYDLAYLAPGYRVPDFSFITQEGDSINSSKLIGKPYILEITPVASRLYQSQYDRTVVIQQIYQNYDLEVFTIPLDKSEVTVNAFFEERIKHWAVADFDSFDIQKLIETFNVTDVPTRILVDQKGNIVRKYVTTEFTDVIQGMNTIINQTKRES
ncbi:MAG: thioredoxin-like domain-containing protein [Balneola sp.]